MDQLRGRVALVTGASRGIGPHIAQALAAEGVHLALTARDGAALERGAERVRALGVRAVALAADLRDAAAREALVRRAEDALGPIDLLVNDAGVESEGAFTALEVPVIVATVELNLTAPLHLSRLVLPGMLARRRGHVVSVASVGGKTGQPYDAVYCGTKAALIEWTAGLRRELAGTGVSLSVVCPGYVTGEGMFARFGVASPARVGACTPEEVARAAVRCIREDLPERIVNSMPLRPLLALRALSPRLGQWIVDRLGLPEFQRAKVERLTAAQAARGKSVG